MSAFIVEKRQIDYILSAYSIGDYDYNEDIYSKMGQILTDQNYASVNYRYEKDTKAPTYKFNFIEKGDTKQALAFCYCLNYQSCETPDYHNSEGKILLNEIVFHLTQNILNLEKYAWTYDTLIQNSIKELHK